MPALTAPHRDRLLMGLFGVLCVVLQLATVFNPFVVEVDHEEMFNAGQAWAILNGHAGDLFRLQYREFCGGCTADALLAVPLFAVFGPRWLVWKMVPVLYTLLAGLVGIPILRRRVGTVAALAFAGLLLLPPRTFLHLSLIGWGNHYEAGMVAATGLLVLADALAEVRPGRLRLVGAGLLLGGAVWVGFSGGFGLVTGALVLAGTRRLRASPWVLGGVLLGLSPWALQYLSTGQHAFVTIYEAGESIPLLSRIPHKLHTLLAPRQLAALFGMPQAGWGYALGWGWAGVLALSVVAAARGGGWVGRTVAAGLLVWTGVYLLVRFQVAEPAPPALAVPGSCRYAAPLYPLAMGLIAISAEVVARRGNRLLLALLLGLPFAGGLVARAEAFGAPFPAPSVWSMHAVDWPYFRNQFSYVVPMEAHMAPATRDSFLLGAHAYGAARETASGLLRDARLGDLQTLPVRPDGLPARGWWQGVGDALGSFHQNRLEGTLAILRRSAELLEQAPGIDPPARQRALRGVAAWQMHAADGWIRAIDRHDAETFSAVHAALDGEADPIADAGWWAVGFTWAHHVVGWNQPVPVLLPDDPKGIPLAFVEGFAHGLGEEWGPQERMAWPTGLPHTEAVRHSFEQGFADGLVDRWLGAHRVPALE